MAALVILEHAVHRVDRAGEQLEYVVSTLKSFRLRVGLICPGFDVRKWNDVELIASVVDEAGELVLLPGRNLAIEGGHSRLYNGEANFRLRISVLSSQRNQQKFSVCITTAYSPHHCMLPRLSVNTALMRTVTKLRKIARLSSLPNDQDSQEETQGVATAINAAAAAPAISTAPHMQLALPQIPSSFTPHLQPPPTPNNFCATSEQLTAAFPPPAFVTTQPNTNAVVLTSHGTASNAFPLTATEPAPAELPSNTLVPGDVSSSSNAPASRLRDDSAWIMSEQVSSTMPSDTHFSGYDAQARLNSLSGEPANIPPSGYPVASSSNPFPQPDLSELHSLDFIHAAVLPVQDEHYRDDEPPDEFSQILAAEFADAEVDILLELFQMNDAIENGVAELFRGVSREQAEKLWQVYEYAICTIVVTSLPCTCSLSLPLLWCNCYDHVKSFRGHTTCLEGLHVWPSESCALHTAVPTATATWTATKLGRS